MEKQSNISQATKLETTTEKPYIKLYLRDISRLWSLNKQGQVLFGEMLKLVTYNPTDKIHNVVELTARNKQQMKALLANEESTANTLYSRGIKNLLNSGIITKLAVDMYYISHEICSRTNWSNTEAMRAIKVETIYEAGSRTLMTFVEEYPDYTRDSISSHRTLNE